jgi:hypothetical protein
MDISVQQTFREWKWIQLRPQFRNGSVLCVTYSDIRDNTFHRRMIVLHSRVIERSDTRDWFYVQLWRFDSCQTPKRGYSQRSNPMMTTVRYRGN